VGWDVLQGGQYNRYQGSGTYVVTLTANATANLKGGYVEIASSLTNDVYGLSFTIGFVSSVSQTLTDLAVGAVGSEQIVIANIMHEPGRVNVSLDAFFPLYIPAGTRVSGRCQASVGGVTVQVAMITVSKGYATWPIYHSVTTYGAATADSGGTQVDPGLTQHTKGNWSQITASTSDVIKAMVGLVGNQANSADATQDYRIDYGIGSPETVLIPDVLMRGNGSIDHKSPRAQMFYVNIPSGTRLAVRAQSSNTDGTDRLCDVVLYGLS